MSLVELLCYSLMSSHTLQLPNLIALRLIQVKSGAFYFIVVVCHDTVNGRLWSFDSNHMVGEWIAGGYPSCNKISHLLRMPAQCQASGKTHCQRLDMTE